ncbi:MAG TPA: site-specific integrase [Actinomycetota bacterium]
MTTTETKARDLPRGVRLVSRTGSYEAMYRGRDHKLYSRTFSPKDFQRDQSEREQERAKTRAVRAAREWIEANKPTRGQQWISPNEGKRTLRELYAEMSAYFEAQSRPYAPATVALHDQLWKALAKADAGLLDTEIADLASAQIDRALAGIEKPRMRDSAQSLVQRVGNYAVFLGYVSANPVRRDFKAGTREERVRKSARSEGKDERMPDTGEVASLVAAMADRYRALVLVMAFEGLRPGEAFGLRVEDLDFTTGTITVRRSLTKGRVGQTKTGQTRTLPMIPSPAMADALKSHLERYPSDGYVFTTEDGSPIESDNYRKRVFEPAAEAAKVNGSISPNQLRHHAASYWIGKGANILQVSKLLGHSKPSITLDVYSRLFGDSLLRLASLGGGDDLPVPALEGGGS